MPGTVGPAVPASFAVLPDNKLGPFPIDACRLTLVGR
jgi:hypothetical protein